MAFGDWATKPGKKKKDTRPSRGSSQPRDSGVETSARGTNAPKTRKRLNDHPSQTPKGSGSGSGKGVTRQQAEQNVTKQIAAGGVGGSTGASPVTYRQPSGGQSFTQFVKEAQRKAKVQAKKDEKAAQRLGRLAAEREDEAKRRGRAIDLLAKQKPVNLKVDTGVKGDAKVGTKGGLDLSLKGAAKDVGNLLLALPTSSGPLNKSVLDQTHRDAQERVSVRAPTSPVIKIVSQVTRPSSAVAGATREAIHGRNPVKGAVRGFVKNDQRFSKVLNDLGWKGEQAEAFGLALDIALDPTTYARLGFRPAEVEAAQNAAKTATKTEGAAMRKAAARLKAGRLSEETYQRIQAGSRQRIQAAANKAAREERARRTVGGLGKPVADRRGLQVGMGNRTRTVAVVPERVSNAGRRVQQGAHVNEVLTRLNPKARPTGVSSEAWQTIVQARREGSAAAGRLERDSQALARLVQEVTRGDEVKLAKIVDAIEAGKISTLPPREAAAAERIVDFVGQVREAFGKYGVDLSLRQTLNTSRELDQIIKQVGKRKRQAGDAADVARVTPKALVDELQTLRRAVKDPASEAAFLARAREVAEQTGRKKPVRLVDEAVARTKAGAPPEAYVPRQSTEAVQRILSDDKAAGEFMGTSGAPSQARPGNMKEREVARTRLADTPGRDFYSPNVPLLMSLYGFKMGRRLEALHFFQAVMGRHAAVPTLEGLRGGGVAWRQEGSRWVKVDPKDAQAAVSRGRADGMFMLDPAVSKHMEPVLRGGEPSKNLAALDKAVRGWKMANTIARPGFFVNTIVGNTWQLYLRDALKVGDLRAGIAAAAYAVADARSASKLGGRPIANYARRRLADMKVRVDGRPTPVHELVDEALDAGAIHVGSQIIDPTDLSPVRQADLNTRAGRLVSRLPGDRTRKLRPLDGAGQIAEALDDMGKLTLYIRARKQGLAPAQATDQAFRGFIDYTSMTPFERNTMKRLMPFYMYTARNLPIQLKGLFERPGKLANLEKVREQLEDWTGLSDDPIGERLLPADQERLPFTIPGVTSGGRQVYTDLRLPVADISRPLNLIGGGVDAVSGRSTDALLRGFQRYLADFSPVVKTPVELALNRRFDFDRPISEEGETTNAAPAVSKLLDTLGLGDVLPQHMDKRTGESTETIPSRVDYLLRMLGGSPASAILNLGKDDSGVSGVSGNVTAASSFLGGVGNRAPRKEDILRVNASAQKAKLVKQRQQEQDDHGKTERYYELSDQIDQLSDITTHAKAAVGYPESKDRAAELDAKALLDRIRGKVEKSPAERVNDDKLEAIRDQISGKAGVPGGVTGPQSSLFQWFQSGGFGAADRREAGGSTAPVTDDDVRAMYPPGTKLDPKAMKRIKAELQANQDGSTPKPAAKSKLASEGVDPVVVKAQIDALETALRSAKAEGNKKAVQDLEADLRDARIQQAYGVNPFPKTGDEDLRYPADAIKAGLAAGAKAVQKARGGRQKAVLPFSLGKDGTNADGNIVSVPGAPGEEAAKSIVDEVEFTTKKFGVKLTDAFDRDRSAGHKSPGHNVTGTAADFAGSDKDMARAVKYWADKGYTVYYDGTNGSIAAAGHGPSTVAGGNAHLHVEFGKPTNAPRPGVTPEPVKGQEPSRPLGAQPSSTPAKTPDTRLLPSQQEFVAKVAKGTGLSPKVVAAWALAEENQGAARSRDAEGNHNWLNIGWFDSGRGKLTYDKTWGSPDAAAQATIDFLKGKRFGASQGIRNILKTAGKSEEDQIAAIAGSGWASSGYGNGNTLRSLIGSARAGASSASSGAPSGAAPDPTGGRSSQVTPMDSAGTASNSSGGSNSSSTPTTVNSGGSSSSLPSILENSGAASTAIADLMKAIKEADARRQEADDTAAGHAQLANYLASKNPNSPLVKLLRSGSLDSVDRDRADRAQETVDELIRRLSKSGTK